MSENGRRCAGSIDGAGLLRCAVHFRHRGFRLRLQDRVALPGHGRAAHLHLTLPLEGTGRSPRRRGRPYWQVWGDEWQEPLDWLRAHRGTPRRGREGRRQGLRTSRLGERRDSLGPDKGSPTLIASDVPAGQFVEMRVVFPRELLSLTGGARVEQGDGLQQIMAEEAADAVLRPARHGLCA